MQSATSRASNGSVELAWERFGPGTGEPLLLIMGFAVHRQFWPEGLCAQLVAAGFDVVRFDNRDAGESTHLTHLRAPSWPTVMTVPKLVSAYRLDDLATDAVAVMRAARWESAHVVGVSMGGMIAQTLAIKNPARVRSLTSISSTPAPKIGKPTLAGRRVFLLPQPRTAEEAADRIVQQFRIIGSPGYPLEEDWLREYAAAAFRRSHDPAGMARQLAAVLAGGSRVEALRAVRVPTLVIHGTDDPLIRAQGGLATARAVPGSRLVLHGGMGHDLPRALWPTITTDIARTAGI
ncbi:MAG TPA: alpha/beta hydrolase [Sporichthya sp.]|nr:alpha/beta hydrolase [Sporichthya sp.]